MTTFETWWHYLQQLFKFNRNSEQLIWFNFFLCMNCFAFWHNTGGNAASIVIMWNCMCVQTSDNKLRPSTTLPCTNSAIFIMTWNKRNRFFYLPFQQLVHAEALAANSSLHVTMHCQPWTLLHFLSGGFLSSQRFSPVDLHLNLQLSRRGRISVIRKQSSIYEIDGLGFFHSTAQVHSLWTAYHGLEIYLV